MRGNGDGWVRCDGGHRHWGRFGAAGLLLRFRPADGEPLVLLQHRALWSHHGGAWGLPGGSRDLGETPEQTALRETSEETPLAVNAVLVLPPPLVDDHGGWSYTTVLAETPDLPRIGPRGAEGISLRWVPRTQVTDLPLHPGLAATWPRLASA